MLEQELTGYISTGIVIVVMHFEVKIGLYIFIVYSIYITHIYIALYIYFSLEETKLLPVFCQS